MKKTNIAWIVIPIIALIATTGCQKKRISYTDMIKRENKEIQIFMDKQGFTLLKSMPERALAPNEFVRIKEGLYLNIVNVGEMIKEDKATLITRFSAKSIGDREKFSFNSAGNTNTHPYPLPFIYVKGSDQAHPDPKASVTERSYDKYLCNAMVEALNYVGYGGKVRMIVSFRNGPIFTTNNGIAIFFDEMSFQKKP